MKYLANFNETIRLSAVIYGGQNTYNKLKYCTAILFYGDVFLGSIFLFLIIGK